MAALNHERILQALQNFCEEFPDTCLVLEDEEGKLVYSVRYNPELGFSGSRQLAALASVIRDRSDTSGKLTCKEEPCGTLYLTGAAGDKAAGYAFSLLLELLSSVIQSEAIAKEAQQQRRFQEAMAEAVSDGLLLIDGTGHVRYMNCKGARILGVSREWGTGRHIAEIVDFRPVILDVIASGKGYTDKEFLVTGKSGKTYHFMKTAIPIRDKNGVLTGVVDLFREIRKVQKMVTSMSGLLASFTFDDIIGDSEPMRECIRMARIAAQSSSNVLIQGESGTGKELLAQAIHNESSLREGPFVAVNCAAIPRELVESELFGYEDGAFTGASKGGRPGKFELANEGTIFLDEIGDMPLDMQVKLLRVIQERRFMRIGGSNVFSFSGRIIAASNRDLLKEIEEGGFRRDLYYRLNVLTVNSPPVRARKEDIEPTVKHIIARVCAKLDKLVPGVDEAAMQALTRYHWPGNVREIENVLERAVNVAQGEWIELSDLPGHFSQQISGRPITMRTLDAAEEEAIRTALVKTGRNISQAASALGVSRNTLYNKMRKFGLIQC